MSSSKQGSASGIAELNERLGLLAAVEPSDAPFISCYLDLTSGVDAGLSYLEGRVAQLRPVLRGSERSDLEAALALVHQRLHAPLAAETRGVAIFARGLAGGQFVSTIETALPWKNRFAFYPVPDLVPLAEAVSRDGAFTLILARQRGGIRVIDVDLGRQVPRAWLAMPGRPVVDAGSGGSGRWGRKHHLAACDAPARFARRVLAAQTRLPIVIAGDRPSLERVATMLPQRSLQHLVAEIEIGGELADTAAVEQACALMRDRYDRHGVAMGRRLNRGLVSNGDALAGPGAALDALDAGIVKTLLVTQEPSPDPGWHCQSCGHVGTHESLPGRCRRCGHEHVKPWLAPVELVRLAVQGGVNVLVTPEHVLRDYGGIACVLTETGMLQALPAPHAPRLVA